MEKIEVVAGRMEAQLKELGAKLDRLEADSARLGPEARTNYGKQVGDLEAQIRAWGERIDKIVVEAGTAAAPVIALEAPALIVPNAAAPESSANRGADMAEVEMQLNAWSLKLNELGATYGGEGAAHDGFHIRVDELRAHYASVQDKYIACGKAGANGAFAAFRVSIAGEWDTLEAGFKDLLPQPAPLRS
jgi:hypothetical protein